MKKRWAIALALMLMSFTVSGCIKFTGLEPAEESKAEQPSETGEEPDTEDTSAETGEASLESESETEEEGPVATGEQIGHLREVFKKETVYLGEVGYTLGETGFCEKIEAQGWHFLEAGNETEGAWTDPCMNSKDLELGAREYGWITYERSDLDWMSFYVVNPSSSARPVSQCVLYRILAYNLEVKGTVNASLPGTVGIGSTDEDVTACFGTPGMMVQDYLLGLNISTYVSYEYSSLVDPDGYYELTIETRDGIVAVMDLARHFDEEVEEDEPGETVIDLEEFGLRIRMPAGYPVSTEEELTSTGNARWTNVFMSSRGNDFLQVKCMTASAYSTADHDEEAYLRELTLDMKELFPSTASYMEGSWGEPETVEIGGQAFTGARWDGTIVGVGSSVFIYCQDTGETLLFILTYHLGESGKADGNLEYIEPLI